MALTTDPPTRSRAHKPWLRHGPRPRWRGRLHQIAALVVIPLAVALVARAQGADARAGAAVFGLSAFTLFATSATYHRLDWSERWLLWMKRADHTAIFVLVAGTYTPVALLVLDGWQRPFVLVGAWTCVVGGAVAAALGLFEKRGAANTAYIGMGWLAVLMAPQLISNLSGLELGLIVLGGLLYTVGAIGLALQRPDPRPAVFGYHEVWHTYTIVAAAMHAGAIWLLTG